MLQLVIGLWLIIYLGWIWAGPKWVQAKHPNWDGPAWYGLYMAPTELLGLIVGICAITFPRKPALLITFGILSVIHGGLGIGLWENGFWP